MTTQIEIPNVSVKPLTTGVRITLQNRWFVGKQFEPEHSALHFFSYFCIQRMKLFLDVQGIEIENRMFLIDGFG